ncbi:hypothetical protein MKX01_005888, partial [Papaver californicum]
MPTLTNNNSIVAIPSRITNIHDKKNKQHHQCPQQTQQQHQKHLQKPHQHHHHQQAGVNIDNSSILDEEQKF